VLLAGPAQYRLPLGSREALDVHGRAIPGRWHPSDLGLRSSQRVVVAMVVGRRPAMTRWPSRSPLARHVGLLAIPLIADGIDPPVSSREVAPNNSTVAYSQRARDRPATGAGSGLSTRRYGRPCTARPDGGGVPGYPVALGSGQCWPRDGEAKLEAGAATAGRVAEPQVAAVGQG
jgi:hypothetical protein